MNIDIVQVLLIDDDEDDFVNLRGILREIPRSKHNLTWKLNYHDGLTALRESKYDVCLLDHRLGERTGLELLQEAVTTGIRVPVILLTGFGDFDLDIRAMQLGAADYLVKEQITAPLLERAIRYAMKHALDMREVEEQTENFRTLFNSTFEGILVHRAGTIVDANAAAGQIFGGSTSSLLNQHINSLFRDGARTTFLMNTDASHFPTEVIGIGLDGHEIPLSIAGRQVTLHGQNASLLAVRDLTLRKQMEAQILQQDRLASLGLLASSLAHEIGTPLGVIRGRAELAAKSGDEKLKSTMELITGQIDRIGKLVNSLLHIARGNHSDMVADVEIQRVTGDVTNLMSHELQRKNIELSVQVPDSLTVRSEAGPLGQVLLNLMVNSVHAIEDAIAKGRTSNHKVEIVAEPSRDGQHVELRVRDTGCGIPPQNLTQLFKPFFTTKDIGAGTGLGLATSFKLVQSWGGTIAVESKVGEGTLFKIRLKRGG